MRATRQQRVCYLARLMRATRQQRVCYLARLMRATQQQRVCYLARLMRAFCPPLRPVPRSPTMVSSLLGNCSMSVSSPHTVNKHAHQRIYGFRHTTMQIY